MLAVYLAVAEAKNIRIAQNTANGIRRAKLMGRYSGKPIKLKSNEEQMIKGLHEPLISESLFNQVQSVINTRKKFTAKRGNLAINF